jgi:spore maturation protein CgeB
VTIVLAGDWHSTIHERPMADALERLGHTVEPFAWHTYFKPHAGVGASFPSQVLRKAQNKYLVGPVIRQINEDLIRLAERVQPDLLFVYRGTHVTAATLRAIRRRAPHTQLVGYNNDDPFAAGQPRWPWRHFITAIPEYDRVFAYRRHNIADFVSAGARSTGLLLPWFVPSVHRPVSLTPEERAIYECDVVFVGHFEDDGRLECLEALAAASVRVKIFGPGRGFRGHDWDARLRASAALRHLAPVDLVWGADYTKALCGAKIALCFLSKRNRDVYTRRCFEIPATGTLMLSEYSDELAALFREGVDADFFRTRDELVGKVQRYLGDDLVRQRIAGSGRDRAFADGHDVESRMRVMLQQLAECEPRAKAG